MTSSQFKSNLKTTVSRNWHWLLPGILLTLLIISWISSLSWRMVLDAPMLMYPAFLYNQFGTIFYKELFEINMPGAVFSYVGIGKVFGYTDLGFRLADLFIFVLIAISTYGILSRFGSHLAWIGLCLWGLFYLKSGQSMTLEREVIGILPISLAIWLALSAYQGQKEVWKIVGSGVFWGCAALIKPLLAIGILPCMWLLSRQEKKEGQPPKRIKLVGLMALGVLFPLLMTLIWLMLNGALESWLEITLSYLPLHLGQTHDHEYISGANKAWYLLRHWLWMRGEFGWLIPIGFFAWTLFNNKRAPLPKNRVEYVFLLLLTVPYFLYPVFSGQFYQYHWMPLFYCQILCVAVSISWVEKSSDKAQKPTRLIQYVLLVFAIFLSIQPPQKNLLPIEPHFDRLTAHIRDLSTPDDLIQPMDWGSGASYALMRAKRRPATRFLNNYHFAHHISSRYIQKIRAEFIHGLKSTPPKLIVEMKTASMVWGEDCSYVFPAYESFLEHNYQVEVRDTAFVIYMHLGQEPE